MAEPDHGDGEVTAPGDVAKQSSAESTSTRRRRASRPAGPPKDADPTSTPKTRSGPTQTSKPTGKPVKSSPMGRKRKPTPTPTPTAAEPSTTAEAVDLVKPPVTEPAAVAGKDAEQTPVTATRVSYRERRSAGKRSESSAKTKTGPKKKRANLRGLGVVLAAITALGLIAAMAVASTFFVLGTNKIDERNDLRGEYSAFARQMVTNLTTLDPQNIDASIKSFQDDTSGKAMEQVGQSVQQTVNMIKSENVSTKGTVISEAVTASDANSATVIMVFGWEMNQPNVTDQQTVLQTFRWKLEITRINGELKLTNVEWVT